MKERNRNMKNAKTLAEMFAAHIEMILEGLKGHIVVFDFDGTMTEFRYAKESLLPCRDDEVYEYSMTHNIYANARMLETMKYIIANLDRERVFVLTRTETTLIDKKNEAILKNFEINAENIFHVQDANNKLAVLRNLHNEFNENIVFVEDTFKTILNAEEAMSFVKGIHISSFLI